MVGCFSSPSDAALDMVLLPVLVDMLLFVLNLVFGEASLSGSLMAPTACRVAPEPARQQV